MAGSISIRISIRWLPGEPGEPTSTLVLTSPMRLYVDLRILKDNDGTIEHIHGSQLPLKRLEWAIAGTSSSTTRHDGGESISHSRWEHWIDSRTEQPEQAADEGDMYPQQDGTTLEKGHMVNPETGMDTPYEEVWDDEDVVPRSNGEQVCVVMRFEDGKERGLAIRLGRWCQGFLRAKEDMAVERWDGAARQVRIGQGEMPCEAMVTKGTWRVGDEVKSGERTWRVVEVA